MKPWQADDSSAVHLLDIWKEYDKLAMAERERKQASKLKKDSSATQWGKVKA